MEYHTIDVHSHILLAGLMGCCGSAGPEMGVDSRGISFFRAGSYKLENVRFVGSPFSDTRLRLEHMERLRLDHQIVSPNPVTYFYRQPTKIAVNFNKRQNDLIADVVRENQRLDGMASLPMQDPEAAVRELVRAIEELGLVGSYIGSDIAGIPLSDGRFNELWSEHERLGVPVVIHPAPRGAEGAPDGLFERWDLDIIFGFLVDEGMAVAHLLLSGVLDRHPRLQVHVPHGGGFAPYQIGRLRAGLAKRPWGTGMLMRPFEEQWAQLTFDSAVHSLDALSFLVSSQGPNRVLLGSNFAGWDQEESSVAMVEDLSIEDTAKRNILGDNARRLFHIG